MLSDKIHKILLKQVEKYHVQKEAQLLTNGVQWFYLKNENEVKFSADKNITIEKAFQAKCKSVKIQDRSGEEYEIDFSKMVENPVKDSTSKIPVIRRDLIDKGSLATEKPKHWADMKSNENLMIVPLNSSDPEYIKVVQEFHKSVGSSMPIVKVERIENLTLHAQYMAKKRQMDTRKDNEHVLWHGTHVVAMNSINAHGFNRSFCGACSIGNGVYFAVHASYSVRGYAAPDSNGDKRIYQCRVLTSDYTQGQSGIRMPPSKSPTQPHILYDSVVDNTQSPSMFVIFHDAQAYPDYIITFK
ncbi:hypothetical protein CHS0354_014712 [Potamilus streckersoni]|uniref:Poly [ADP-ribose] polymerase n=1 Tax=Potamilus streckersoni TaxID=2493646 RepID=A0AAE0SPK5_9BIVA|nr:hypothetical protein CHS0354_014712 [Potamilus streckersoni]